MSKLKIVYEYIKSDFVRYGKSPKLQSILGAVLFGNNHCFKFSFWWRLSSQSNPFNLLAKIQTRRYRRKYGLQIPKEDGCYTQILWCSEGSTLVCCRNIV